MMMADSANPVELAVVTAWSRLLGELISSIAAIKQAEPLRDCAANYHKLSEAARDLAWEMKVGDVPVPEVLLPESMPKLVKFNKAFGRLFVNGAPRSLSAAADTALRHFLNQSFAEPLHGGGFDVSTANTEQVEAFGLAARRMERYLEALPRIKGKEARKLRAGDRGQLPSVMTPILKFMDANKVKPRQMALALLDYVAHIRRIAAPDNPHAAVFDNDDEWGPRDGDRTFAYRKWEHRINQKLYRRSHAGQIRAKRQRPKR
jgi:hypothetical protein